MVAAYQNAVPQRTSGSRRATSRAQPDRHAPLQGSSLGRDLFLAGDVGGTKTLLEIGSLRNSSWVTLFSARYFGAQHADFFSVLNKFFSEWTEEGHSPPRIKGACFGVAGPVFENRAELTNLPWSIDGAAIAKRFGITSVKVVNDFAAAAKGIELLGPSSDLVTLQSGEPVAGGPRVVLGPGTGLGVAYLVQAGTGYLVIAGEGGHAAFAPATPEALDLLRDLYSRQERVSAENVISGPGLVRIYEFLCRRENKAPRRATAMPADEGAAAITEAALNLGDPMCLRALDLFIACFGALAGDHALAVMARGGVYIAGGIAPKILPRLKQGKFCAAFNAKGRHSAVVEKIPVHVVTNARLGLLGAALLANE